MAIKIGSLFRSIFSYAYSGLNYKKVNDKLGSRYYTDGLSCRRLALLSDSEMGIFRGILDQAQKQKLISVAAEPVRVNTTWFMHRFAMREMLSEAEDLHKLDHTRLTVRSARLTQSKRYALDLDHVRDEIHSALVSQQTTKPALTEGQQPLERVNEGVRDIIPGARTDAILRGVVEMSEVFSGLTTREDILQTVRRVFHRDRDLISPKDELAAVEVTILVPDGDGNWKIDIPEETMRTAFENRFLITDWGGRFLEGAPADQVLRRYLHAHEVAGGEEENVRGFSISHLNLKDSAERVVYGSDFAHAHLDQFEGSPEMGVVVLTSTDRDYRSHNDAIVLFHNRQCSLRTDLGSPLPIETQQFRYHILFEKVAQALLRVRYSEGKKRITREQSVNIFPLGIDIPAWSGRSIEELEKDFYELAMRKAITKTIGPFMIAKFVEPSSGLNNEQRILLTQALNWPGRDPRDMYKHLVTEVSMLNVAFYLGDQYGQGLVKPEAIAFGTGIARSLRGKGRKNTDTVPTIVGTMSRPEWRGFGLQAFVVGFFINEAYKARVGDLRGTLRTRAVGALAGAHEYFDDVKVDGFTPYEEEILEDFGSYLGQKPDRHGIFHDAYDQEVHDEARDREIMDAMLASDDPKVRERARFVQQAFTYPDGKPLGPKDARGATFRIGWKKNLKFWLYTRFIFKKRAKKKLKRRKGIIA